MESSLPSSVPSGTFGQNHSDLYIFNNSQNTESSSIGVHGNIDKEVCGNASNGQLFRRKPLDENANTTDDTTEDLHSCGSSFYDLGDGKNFAVGKDKEQMLLETTTDALAKPHTSSSTTTTAAAAASRSNCQSGTTKDPRAQSSDGTHAPKGDNHHYNSNQRTGRKPTLLVSDSDDEEEDRAANSSSSWPKPASPPPTCDSNVEIEDLRNRIGRLWWAESNQDLRRKYERDKYGRLLIPNEERLGGRADNLKKFGSAPATAPVSQPNDPNSDSDDGNFLWYKKSIINFNCVTENWFGELRNLRSNMMESEPSAGFANYVTAKNCSGIESMDDKLQSSMVLANTVDKAWAKELYEVDALERENIIHEIHGLKSNRSVQETPEFVTGKIRALKEYIDANLEEPLDNGDSIVPPVTKIAYKRGVYHLHSNYLRTKAFLLKFLRACHFDIKKAALRYFRYVDLLYELFGDIALTRPLALSDLTKRELRYLKKGQMQLLPSRDRAGRRMYAFSGCDDWNYNIREKYRTNVYLIDVLSDDETTQKLGAVTLNAPRVGTGNNPFGFEGMTLRIGKQELFGNGKFTEPEFFRKVNEALPVRLTGIHYFAPNTIIYNIGKAIILSMLGKEDRKIIRFHAGSQLECDYSLRSFGIPHEDLTITEGDNIKTKNVQKFLKARQSIEAHREQQQKRKEQQRKNKNKNPVESLSSLPPLEDDYDELAGESCPGIECPEVDCIVFGDKTLNNHPANVEFREILKIMERDREQNKNSYKNNSINSDSPGDEDKTQSTATVPIKEFIEQIIRIAKSPQHNLQFLVFDKQTHLFMKIDDHNELCKRVSQALRDQRKRFRLEDSRHQQQEQSLPFNVGGNRNEYALSTGSMMGADAAKRLKRASRSGSCLPAFCS